MTENLNPRFTKETPELEIDPPSIAVTAITLYPDWYAGEPKSIRDTNKIRGDLALESIRKAIQLGYRVVIADGPSSQEFKENLADLGVEVLRRDKLERSVGGRQAIEKASVLDGVKVIIKTEPEKVSFIEDCILQTALPIIEGRADIVVPKRNEELNVQTYPEYMHASEARANRQYNNLLHRVGLLPQDKSLEFFFGPIVLKNDPHVIALFMEQYDFQGPRVGGRKYAQPEEWSDIQLFPIVKALFLGLRVEGVEIPFRYPEKQKENEEANKEGFAEKRKQQRVGLVTELIHYIRLLSEDPKVKGKSKLTPIKPVNF